MQRDEQLMTTDNDFLIKEIAEDLASARNADKENAKRLYVEVIEDFLELIKRNGRE